VLGPENVVEDGGNGESTYGKESTTSNNAVGETVETVQGAPGAINRLTVSVVMDQAVAGNLNQNQVEDLIGNAVGLDAARGDDITVASMAFDTTAADQAAAELEAAQAAEEQAQLWSMIKTGGIALGIALLVLIVWLRSRRNRVDDEDYEDLALPDDVLAELDRIRIESTREIPVDNAAMELEAAERQRVRGEIATMVSEKPDEVAAMLRGWLSESGRKS
jgi:flagellar M-ring protein FliF